MRLPRLESIGIRGVALSLFNGYRQYRKQVAINEANSKLEIVENGVPQDTVLGPILFNVYLKSLLKRKYTGDLISCANDLICGR